MVMFWSERFLLIAAAFQHIKRAGGFVDMCGGKMNVNAGCLDVFVTQKSLNYLQVSALLIKVGCETMTQCMGSTVFAYAGFFWASLKAR